MVEFQINPATTCLLIIDMTNVFVKQGAYAEVPGSLALVPKLKRLISVFREKGIRIIFTTHVYRENGADLGLTAVFKPRTNIKEPLREGTPEIDIYSELQPQKEDILVVKRRYSAFLGTELDLILRSNKIDTLVIAGVASNVCCECTARDARMRDYKVIFLSDGTAARGFPKTEWGDISPSEAQNYVLATMAASFAEVLSVDKLIDRLLNHPAHGD